ncbi:putative transport protein [Staphylococcus petrasii]|uniref:DMT family transporter n=1 Tax=Staphylococcus petrasii TaxID=1276936 RepID=A0A380FXA8_9STAP|nr:DMT family transporter [Staphylococcus petrasii]PNZ28591.1 EamA family transporter [Staphylococcus petrasii]TGE11871.1 DMT family transporter [Staphylococcus petrasii]TGE16315.1 DMT family transporter [Staphylococcus petrasii]SUM42770.1 putative transport protein [Staphylococcus petrasii]
MKLQQRPYLTFYVCIILTTICMGSSFPTGKYLISIEHVPPMLLGGWRFIIAGLLILIFILLKMGLQEILPKSNGSVYKGFVFVLVIGLLQTGGTMGLLNIAMALGVSSSISAVLLFTNPLWLAVLAHFLLNERLTKMKCFALVLGVTGVAICLGLDRTLLGWGALVALLGSLCWSCNTIVTKLVTFDKGAWVLTGWQLLLGGIIMLFISVILREHYSITYLNGWGWLWFWWLVFPASIGSFGLWFSSLKMRGATIASSFLFLVPLFSTIFSIIGLGEPFTLHIMVGGLCVIIALFFINYSPHSSNY